jgi:uncharacterized protein YbaR (Trm112 family)
MRKDMMEILVCPVCKGELTLKIDQESDNEVVEGSLHCASCNETYPINQSIPNLLPPDLRRSMEAGKTA